MKPGDFVTVRKWWNWLWLYSSIEAIASMAIEEARKPLGVPLKKMSGKIRARSIGIVLEVQEIKAREKWSLPREKELIVKICCPTGVGWTYEDSLDRIAIE